MDLRIGPREAIAQWVLDTAGLAGAFLPDFKVIGVFEGNTLLGAVVYDAFTARDCNLHICVSDRRCVTRRVVRAVFDYPFRQLHLDRVSAQVWSDNAPSLEFVQRLGFVLEGAKRLPDKFQLQFGLQRHECHWLNEPIYQFAELLKGAA
jgi:hypothetical protein